MASLGKGRVGWLILLVVVVMLVVRMSALRGQVNGLVLWAVVFGIVALGALLYAGAQALYNYLQKLKSYRQSMTADTADDEPFVSLVLLLAQPRVLTDADVRTAVQRALGVTFATDDPNTTTFVVPMPSELGVKQFGHAGYSFMVKIPQGAFFVHSFPCQYPDATDAAITAMPDLRLQRVMREHQAWLSVDLLRPGTEDASEQEAYRTIGALLAAFAAADCLGVVCPALGTCVEVNPQVIAGLASDDPLAIFTSPSNVPVLGFSDDDPRLLAATAEAKRRWPEFVTAFTQATPAERARFSVKARFADAEHTEFMWVGVRAITETDVTGTLGNDPNYLTHLKLNDVVTVPLDDISDWLYFQDEEMVGGLSITVLAEVMREK